MNDSTYPQGGGDSTERDEVLEQRGWWMPMPFGQLPRRAVVPGAVALLVGLAAGYAVGVQHARKTTAPPPRSRAAATLAAPTVVGDFPLRQAGPACFTQAGRELQLGVQVSNVSAAAITVRRVEVVLPLGGLETVSQAWGTCGELPATEQMPGNVLPAGASTWFTVTLRPLITCPQASPVMFRLDYVQAGRPGVAALPGFNDLGQVPYAGCT